MGWDPGNPGSRADGKRGKMGDMTSTAMDASTTTDTPRLWVNGQLIDTADQANISATDHGLVVGDGVFEALKVTGQGGFAIRRHLERLSRSAKALDLPDPDHDQVREGIDAVLADRTWTDGKLRITYTGGAGPLGSGAAFGPPTLVVASQVTTPPAPSTSIVTTPWTRNETGAMAGVKSTSYGENVRGLAYAAEREATEGIFVNNQGNLCEGTGSNIFCVFGSRIVTPPLSSGPLAGITRGLVLEWCDVAEEDLTVAKAMTADEVFITSSLRDVQAVAAWDAVQFEVIGPVTTEVMETFATRSGADLDP